MVIWDWVGMLGLRLAARAGALSLAALGEEDGVGVAPALRGAGPVLLSAAVPMAVGVVREVVGSWVVASLTRATGETVSGIEEDGGWVVAWP